MNWLWLWVGFGVLLIAASTTLLLSFLRDEARPRPWLMRTAFALVIGAGAMLLANPSLPVPSRTVFVGDRIWSSSGARATLDDMSAAAWTHTYDAAVIVPDADLPANSSPVWRRPGELQSWAPHVVQSIDEGIAYAAARFAGLPWWVKALDLVTLTQYRVQFLVGDAADWGSNSRYKATLETAQDKFLRTVSMVDLVWRSPNGTVTDQPSGELELVPPRYLVTNTFLADPIRLVLRSQLLFSSTPFVAQVRLDLDPAGKATPSSGMLSFSFSDTVTFMPSPDGSVTGEVPLDRFTRVGTTTQQKSMVMLSEGWHLITAKVSGPPGTGSTVLPGTFEAARYVEARRQNALVVLGNGDGFRLDDRSGPASASALRDLWTAVDQSPRRDVALDPAAVQSEQQFTQSPPDVHRPPRVVTLVHVRDDFWMKHETLLRTLVERGVVLMIVGLPRAAQGHWIALKPRLSPAGHSLMLDRRPHVTVLCDTSRIGRLHFRLPSPASPTPTVEDLSTSDARGTSLNGDALQRDFVRRLLDKLGPLGVEVVTAANEVSGHVRGNYITLNAAASAASRRAMPTASTEQQLVNGSQLEAAFQGDWSSINNPWEASIQVNRVAIVLCYDVDQFDPKTPAISKLASSGTLVYVVPIVTDYCKALNRQIRASTPGAKPIAQVLKSQAAETYLHVRNLDTPFAKLSTPAKAQERVVIAPQLSLDLRGGHDQSERLATFIAEDISRRFDARSATISPLRWGRAIDARNHTAGTPSAAPLLTQLLDPNPAGPSAITYAEAREQEGLRGAIEPVPVLFGWCWGAGACYVSAYSIFEGAGDDLLLHVPWAGDASRRVVPTLSAVSGQVVDSFGPQRLIELINSHGELDLPADDIPAISDASLSADGRLRIVVRQNAHQRPEVDALELASLPTWLANPATTPPDQMPGIVGRIVTFDGARQTLTLEFSQQDLARIAPVPEHSYQAFLRRKPAIGALLQAMQSPVRLYVNPGGISGDRVSSLLNLSRLKALTHYLHGGEYGRFETATAAPLRLRPVGIFLLFAILALLWSATLGRDMLLRRTLWRELEDSAQRLTLIAAEGAVREMSTLGQRASQIPAGVVLRRRRFQPGDSMSKILKSSLLIDQMLKTQGKPRPMPEVLDRVEERTRFVRIVIDAGHSMRFPWRSVRVADDGSLPSMLTLARDLPKLHAAASFANLIAQYAWQRRSRVEIRLASVRQPGSMADSTSEGRSRGFVTCIPATDCSQPRQHLARSILEAVNALAPTGPPEQFPHSDEPCTTVYVSDFLLEPLDALAKELRKIEDLAGLVAVAHVSSPAEQLLVGHGRTIVGAVPCPRADWRREDMVHEELQFQQELRMRFDGFEGGFLRVTSKMTPPQMIAAIQANPRLLEAIG